MLSTLREVTLSHLVAQRKNGLSCVKNGDKKLPQMVSLESNTLILLEEVRTSSLSLSLSLKITSYLFATTKGGYLVW